MQQTRLNNIFNSVVERLGLFFCNPWRRLSLIIISLLFGFFLGLAISTTAGQTGYWDITMAAILLLFTELISQFVYSRQGDVGKKRALLLQVINVGKIGMIYSLYVAALTLGS